MKFDFKEILTTFMVLFAVIDIIGNTPFIIDLRKKVGHIQSEKSAITSGIIMIVFLFLGKSLLSIIGIDVTSFEVAGVFILYCLRNDPRNYFIQG
jgi:multiple antibiotic resistance protein